jgi:uncharacterized protein GlcG (DUF336 family)
MNRKLSLMIVGIATSTALMASTIANATCNDVSRSEFETAANTAATETDAFGFHLPMWATMVDETGKVCHVYSTDSGIANTGELAGNKAWLASRVISAQKANTANGFSLDALAISTGAVYVAILPGGSLYGLQHSNPVDAHVAYDGNADKFGSNGDGLRNKRVGGVNVFGGGVALYKGGVKVGAVGASGDTSCRDHAFAYRLRINLGLNTQPNDDGLQLVAVPTALFQQPICGVADPTPHAFDSAAADFGVRP